MRKMLTFLMAAAAIEAPGMAQAGQEAATAMQQASGGGLADIVVTAQKRAESLQDTPISISALDGQALEAKRVVSLSDLTSAVPNMQVSPHPNTGTTLRVALTNAAYYLNHFIIGDIPLAMMGEPRTWGVDVSIKF